MEEDDFWIILKAISFILFFVAVILNAMDIHKLEKEIDLIKQTYAKRECQNITEIETITITPSHFVFGDYMIQNNQEIVCDGDYKVVREIYGEWSDVYFGGTDPINCMLTKTKEVCQII